MVVKALRENEEDVCLEDCVVMASDLVEAEGVALGGDAVEGNGDQISMEGIYGDTPQNQLALATAEDESLVIVKNLAKQHKEGYHEKDGIVFRSRIDNFGYSKDQICLPAKYRPKCLALAHTQFGHQGRNKMTSLIKPFFYWPTMSRDCQEYIKDCVICQKMDKAKPSLNRMQLREVASMPFELVAIDLVGPFPTATGGFRFLLTCIDLATRWPEAVPLKTTTSKVIINHLINMFCRCGFPAAIISNNGPQFVGKTFGKWV